MEDQEVAVESYWIQKADVVLKSASAFSLRGWPSTSHGMHKRRTVALFTLGSRRNRRVDHLAGILAYIHKPQVQMRKLVPLVTLVGGMLLPVLSSAQEVHLYGGYNGSNVAKAGTEQWTGRGGYQFGADLLLGNRVFVMPGIEFLVRNLNYSYAGTAPDGTTRYPSQEYKYTSNSLRIPVMLGIHLIDPSSKPGVNLYVMGGPSAMMNLNANLNNNALNVETNGTQWYLGIAGGLDISFLFVEAGYDIGMSNVFKGNDFETNPKVNFLHINGGIRLRLAK